jgi:hypothetical protein
LIEEHNFFEEFQVDGDKFCGVWLGYGTCAAIGQSFSGSIPPQVLVWF